MKTILIALLLASAGAAQAADLKYDPTERPKVERYRVAKLQMLYCMHDLATIKLRMGERDGDAIVDNLAKLCGGPMQAFLVSELGLDKANATAYTADVGREVLRRLPGVRAQ